jgi:hypothetical protein
LKPRRRGKATRLRSGDDLLIGFAHEDDARRVMVVLGRRWERYGLPLHPDKTRLVPFGRPPQGQQSGQGPATFDLVGCTFSWVRSRRGRWGWGARHGGRASDGQNRPSTLGVDAIGTSRCRSSTPRAADACGAPAMTSASAASFGVCCDSSQRRSASGTSGCAVVASVSACTGGSLRSFFDHSLSRARGSWFGSGAQKHESPRRKSRMREIRSSGSGEGPGWATSRPTLQRPSLNF